MKTINQLSVIILLTLSLLSFSVTGNAQNLLSNGSFNNGTTNWTSNDMAVEINPENVYGGSSSSNRTAEIDAQVGLRQRVSNVLKGYYYQLTYKATRRTNGAPAAVGLRVRIVGSSTNTVYLNNTKVYTNASFGFVNETLVFFLPSNITDSHVFVEFTAFNNNSTLGVIVDDLQLILLGSLPVKWESFTASNINNSVILNWATAAEVNNEYFVIERAGNNNQFDSIGRLKASSSRNYRFVDQKPGTVNMYRIRQVDADGKFQYSKVITIRTGAQENEMKLFPTQAQSAITIQIASDKNIEVSIIITDLNGRVVKQIKKSILNGVNQQVIDITGLQSGVYYAVVRSSDLSINQNKSFHKVD